MNSIKELSKQECDYGTWVDFQIGVEGYATILFHHGGYEIPCIEISCEDEEETDLMNQQFFRFLSTHKHEYQNPNLKPPFMRYEGGELPKCSCATCKFAQRHLR
jgi:hypothetical protein